MNKKSQQGFASLLILLLVLVLLAAGGVYLWKTGKLGRLTKENSAATENTVNITAKPFAQKPDFSYTVKEITESFITLSSKKGDFTLVNDSQNITVYNGSDTKAEVLPLSDLKVGDTLNMEFIPGKTATLYIIK